MSKNPSSRDLIKLSAYLDGELNAPAFRKMKKRLERDPNLRAALDDLRETKNILRRTPQRRAPRNFSLSPQMVAVRPPMPKLVPALNYASLFAMLLFFLSFISPLSTKNAVPETMPEMMSETMMEAPAPAEAPAAEKTYQEEAAMEESMPQEDFAPAAEAPVTEAESQEKADELVEGEEAMGAAPTTAFSPANVEAESEQTAIAPAEKRSVSTEFPSTGTLVAETTLTPSADEIPVPSKKYIFNFWQKILLVIIVLFPLLAYALRRVIITKWQKEVE